MSGTEYDNWEDNIPQEALEDKTQKLSDYASYELGNVEAVPAHVEARIVSGLVALEQRVEQQDKDWLLMMQTISGFDKQTDWMNAGDDVLLEQFDPWETLRALAAEEEA